VIVLGAWIGGPLHIYIPCSKAARTNNYWNIMAQDERTGLVHAESESSVYTCMPMPARQIQTHNFIKALRSTYVRGDGSIDRFSAVRSRFCGPQAGQQPTDPRHCVASDFCFISRARSGELQFHACVVLWLSETRA
jgi:hypothetical protein